MCISLLDHVQAYVQQVAEKKTCPLPIYPLRFVPAAITLLDSDGGSKSATFIVEDRINGIWQKYVGNANAKPVMHPDQPGYERAQYMCFLQHLQFEKTRGLAYISDWQGDSSISSSSSNLALYGEGNIPEAFKNFPKEHTCNDYCIWANLTPPILDEAKYLTDMSTSE
ncbi:hypothetical protein EV360DRAFT_40552 [Lentinula raphanica]|nr:hypothetical protein EV360DRAFT_40552 [Lentinula raphanica]